MAEETAGQTGWWGKFVALLTGFPPISVHAADQDDDDDEPGPFERRPPQ